MNSETRNCQNCKQEFTIVPEDFVFYDKIHVPAPTWCPECRLIRRAMWRNERGLYSRKCDLCEKNIVSIYSAKAPMPVYCPGCFWSDKWGAEQYAQEIDWNKPFFAQLQELYYRTPAISLVQYGTNINSDYASLAMDVRNVYLAYSTVKSEDVYYSYVTDRSRNIIDGFSNKDSEYCYEAISAQFCNSVKYSDSVRSCLNSSYLFDAAGCSNCFMSCNLRNRQYVFRNRQLAKKEWEKEMSSIDFGSYEAVQRLEEEYLDMKKDALHKFANVSKSDNCTGDDIVNSKNCHECYMAFELEDSKYVVRANSAKEYFDVYGSAGSSQLTYEQMGGHHNANCRFFVMGDSLRDTEYTVWCHNANNLFGCISLKNKSNCILNKEYSEEDYFKLVAEIKKKMDELSYIDSMGRVYKYGEFFPIDFSSFAYNEVTAQEYYPLSEKQARERGYPWKEQDERNYRPTLTASQLPDNIKDVTDSITNEIIACGHKDNSPAGGCNEMCTTAYRITPAELEFYRKMSVPLPRLCPNCRHFARLRKRTPFKLWHRHCMKPGCDNEFETSYAPDRPETVYCESCYQQEVV